MFIGREESLILQKYKHQQLLKMFRHVLTKISNLKLNKLHVNVTAMFQGAEFNFDITVFELDGSNTACTIYDFWEVKECQKIVDAFISAIKTEDFEKVKAVKCTAYRRY